MTTITMERTSRTPTRERAEEILHSKLLPGWHKQTTEVVEAIQDTGNNLVDRIAKRSAIEWAADKNTITIEIDRKLEVHDNALQQAASLAEVPASYVELLRHNDPELLAHNLNRRFAAKPDSRQLVRSVRGKALAILSDKYRRIDGRPVLEEVTKAAKRFKLAPMGGSATDVRHHLRLALPQVFEPVPGEFVMFGLNWSSSDFGRGALDIGDFFLRVFCNNGAVTESHIHQIHLGKRIEDTEGILSERTLQLDTMTALSAVRDVINARMDPAKIEERVNLVRLAAQKELTPGNVDAFLKKFLKKEQVQAAREAFLSPDIEMLPQGSNVWRLSNTLSWLANTTTANREQALDFQELAGKVLLLAA